MDKRKGIILAVIIFLLIGLGTFVFANPSEDSLKGNDNSTDKSNDTKEEDLDNENTNDGLEEEGEEEENKPNTNGTTNVVIGGTDDSTGSNENDSVDDEEQNNGDDLTGDEDEDTPSKPSLPEVDKTAPIVVINDKEYQGLDNSAGYLSTEVVLTLAEEDLIVTIIKDGEKVEFIDGMSLSVDGNYTLSVKDEAGNETVVEFSIDKTKPVYTALGLLNLTHYNEKSDITVANIGDKIRIFVQFDEELAVNPQVAFGDGTAVKLNLTSSEAFDKYTYYVDVILTEEMNLKDGNISFKVFGYADAAKNTGDDLTDSDIKTNDNIPYESVRLDTTDPIVKLYADNGAELKDGIFTVKTVKVVVEGEESYTAKLLKNGSEIEFVENKFYDNGNYELTVTDAAGNETPITFNVDKVKPAFYINGKKQDNSKDLGYFNKDDGELTIKLVESNLKEAYVTKDGSKLDIDLTKDFKLSEDGKYVLYAIDKAGTKTEVTFEIDTISPERGYSTLGFEYTDSKDKEYVENNRNKYYYVKENDSFLYKIAFNEQIQNGLIATISGKEIQLSYLDYSKDLGYVYGAEYVVPSDLEENSQLEIIVSNIKDLAGNEYENKTIVDVPTSNGRVAVYDNQKPEINVYKWPKKDNPNALEINSTFNYCVVAEASDINGLSSFTIDGNEYIPGENAHICDDGKHEFKAVDKAGNVNTFEFNIDRTYGAVTINNKDVYNTHDLESTYYYSKITSVSFSETGTVRLTKDGTEVYYGSTEEFNYEFIDGAYKFELFDKGGNPTAFMFEVDSAEPTATIEYSVEKLTNQAVIATLKPSEEVTIINNDGNDTYTFNENGTFVFEFEDKAGNKGTATASVDWIDKVAKGVEFSNNGGNSYANRYDVEVTVLEENIDKVYYVFTTVQTEDKVIKNIFNQNKATLVNNIQDNKFLATLDSGNNNFYLWVKVVDKAGNVSYTRTKNKFKIDTVLDITLFKVNSNNIVNPSKAKEGDWVGVYLQVSEQLTKTPTFIINGEPVQASMSKWENIYAYQAGITVTKDMNGKLDFSITNIEDKAGNTTSLSSEDCDYSVVIDNTNPEITKTLETDLYIPVGMNFKAKDLLTKMIAEDNVDGNITEKISVHSIKDYNNTDDLYSEIDTSVERTYLVHYIVKDEMGNKDTDAYRVHVVSQEDYANVVVDNINNANRLTVNILSPVTINGTDLNIPANKVINGNGNLNISGMVNINNNNITLNNVNVTNSNAASVTINNNVKNIVINGGEYITENVNIQGEGTIRGLGNNTVKISNASLKGGIHLFDYVGSNADLSDNNITLDYVGNEPLSGIVITVNGENRYNAQVIYKGNSFYIQNQPNSFYVAIQRTDWTDIEVVDINGIYITY